MRDLTAEHLAGFFESVDAWRSATSWSRNRMQLFALLKATCKQSLTNPSGPPAGYLFRSTDELPIWQIPPGRWFRDREQRKVSGPQQTPTNGRHGGHSPFEGDLLTFAEFRQVLAACQHTDAPLFWRTLIAWVITYASRRGDFLTMTWDAIDFEHGQFRLRETKGGGLIVAPLADQFVLPLHQLRESNVIGPFVRKTNHLDRWFYPVWNQIWELAGVARRTPHQLRDESSNWWNEHNRTWGDLITGHAAINTRDRHYDRCRRGRISRAFRQAVATYPTTPEPDGSTTRFVWPALS